MTGLYIEETDRLPAEAIALIDKTVWGTQGALYTIPNFHNQFLTVPNVHYLLLKESGRLVGLRAAIEKEVRWEDQTYPAFYHTLFIMDPAVRGRGYGKELAKATVDRFAPRLHSKGLLYAYTEAGNLRSSVIKNTQGYQAIGRFHATAFSRAFPKASPRVTRLPAGEIAAMGDRLARLYQDHALSDLPRSLRPSDYYVVMEGSRILAGIQIKRQVWQIKALEGVGGVLALHAIPHIPILRDLFNPRAFEFLGISNFYVEPERAEVFYELLETVLTLQKLKTGIAFLDKRSPVYQTIARAGSFGIMKALIETEVEVTGYFVGLSQEDVAPLQRLPLVISPFDL